MKKEAEHNLSKNMLELKLQQTQCSEKIKSSLENVRSHNTDLMFQKNSSDSTKEKKSIEEMFGWFQDLL